MFSKIQYALAVFSKKFHKVLRLFYDFRAFISTLRDYSSWLSSSSNWIGEFVHAVPLHWPHASEHCRPCLRQVHLALTQFDEQLHLIICRSDSGAAGRSVIRGVPGLSSPSIHCPPMTYLRFCLSIASLAGTLLDYDPRLFLTSKEDSEAAFENYWLPVSHSSTGSAAV